MIRHQLAQSLRIGFHRLGGQHLQDSRIDVARIATEGGIITGEFLKIMLHRALQQRQCVLIVAPRAPESPPGGNVLKWSCRFDG